MDLNRQILISLNQFVSVLINAMKEKIQQFFTEKVMRFSWQRVGFVLLVLAVAVGVFIGALAVLGYSYKDRVLPGIRLGQIEIGGMRTVELKNFLERMSDKLVATGIRFVYEQNNKKEILIIYPVLAADGNSIELVRFDIDKEADRLLHYGRGENIISAGWQALLHFTIKKTSMVAQNINVDKERLVQILSEKLQGNEQLPIDANVQILSLDPLDFTVTTGNSGIVIDYNAVMREVENNWSMLAMKDINVVKNERQQLISAKEVETITDKLPKIFTGDGLQLNYRDSHTNLDYNWTIMTNQLGDWIEAQKDSDGSLVFGLKAEEVNKFLENKIAPTVNVEARDAKFKMGGNGKVEEFQGSRPGVALDIAETFALINNAFKERSLHESGWTRVITVFVSKVEPNIKTGDVNNLGISEVLGVGVSNYAGSPTNRVKNIRAAVNKLNGILINPGEEFSALKFLQPFTIEGGYLPELVIKGDEIKPEVGGGLCQIGTTLFRMAMNSGMKITSRRNHSLVVNYYNDPSNGNPGTDATVYDPAPDFKFFNDTNNSVLIQTEMDATNQKLYFTLWGMNDGRKSYYSKPIVLRWMKAGEKKNVETTKLKPGEIKCQHAYIGADASFTYTRELADGKKEETVYESHYRPLPEICLVGVAETSASSTPAVGDVVTEG